MAIATAVVVAVLTLAVGLAIILYLVSAEKGDAGRGIVNRMMKRIPMHSVKIIIVVWQILTQVSTRDLEQYGRYTLTYTGIHVYCCGKKRAALLVVPY